MNLISIDPGTNYSGIAVLTVELNPQVLLSRTWKKGEPISSTLGRLTQLYDVKIVAIEDQYQDEGTKKNVNSLIKLCRNAGRWEEGANSNGCRVEWINTQKWIVAELGHKLRRGQIEIISKQKVNALYGVSPRTDHENKAILIGRYAVIGLFKGGMGK